MPGKGFTNDAIPALSACESPIEGKFVQAWFDFHRGADSPISIVASESSRMDLRSNLELRMSDKITDVAACLSIQTTINDRFEGKEYRFDFGLSFQEIGSFVVVRRMIELDGKKFHSTDRQVQIDRMKDRAACRAAGGCIRFSGSEVYNAPDACLHEVLVTMMLELRRFSALMSAQEILLPRDTSTETEGEDA